MKEFLSGNEAIARGVWEAGVKFASAYPGTPSTEILKNVGTYSEIDAEWAPNEKTAAEAAIGASIGGVRSLATMKHVGLNVAADPIFTYAYMGVNGGFVLVTADDPQMHSSQNEQDNRNYARAAKMPMYEPSDSQEAKDMIKDAYRVSEEYDVPVLFRVTTRVCHSKGLVETADRVVPETIPYVKNRAKFDPVPAISRKLRYSLEERLNKLKDYSNNCKWNYAEDNNAEIGIVCNGVSYQYAKEVFGNTANYYKVGFSWPLPVESIKDFSKTCDKLYIIEELDAFMETELKAAGIDCIGKEVIPNMFELNPEIIREAILNEKMPKIDPNVELIVDRPPALCAGCPHRGFFYELAKRKDAVMIGDIGCYALGGSEPLNAKDMAICMGAGFSLAHGMAKAFKASGQDKRVVGVVGDSTFFHTGVNSLTEAIYNKSNPVCCILDNRTTGMTGHQENPGTGYTLKGEKTAIMSIEEMCKAMGVTNIRTVNPLDLKEMKDTINWAFEEKKDELVVIITRYPCVLKKFSEEDKLEFDLTKKQCVVDHDLCIGCRKCLSTGCPALGYDEATRKVTIDPLQCNGCEVCAQVCPVNAIKLVGGAK